MTANAWDLIREVGGLRHVEHVALDRSGVGSTLRVDLDEMNWAVRASVLNIAAAFCRRLEIEHPMPEPWAIDVRLTFPEPLGFTEARVTA